MAPVRASALLIAILGCSRGSSPAQDAATYASVLASAGQDPEGELARCAGLADEATRGDCAAVVAIAAGRRTGDAAAWCDRVPAGKWRDECTFQAAERALTSAGAQDANRLCQDAGQYQADCVIHVWRPQLGRLVNGMGAADFGSRYAAAEQLYQQTVASVGASEGLETMYWLSFFGTGFRASGRVELARCAGLPAEGARRCEQAAAVLVTEPLEGLLRGRGLLSAFCALSPPRSTDVADLLGVAPSAALDAAVAAQQPMICGGGGGPSLSSGLRASPTGGGR